MKAKLTPLLPPECRKLKVVLGEKTSQSEACPRGDSRASKPEEMKSHCHTVTLSKTLHLTVIAYSKWTHDVTVAYGSLGLNLYAYVKNM